MSVLIRHKKAGLNFEILETFEAGIELFGHEVKALRSGKGSLEGARVVVRGGEAFLRGATIPPYQGANTPQSYDPERSRRLLLHEKEINALRGYEDQKGYTVVPLDIHTKGRYIKVSVAAVRGKKKHDKRQTLKERQDKREADRLIKSANFKI